MNFHENKVTFQEQYCELSPTTRYTLYVAMLLDAESIDIFSSDSNLNGISDESLSVTDYVHKAFINVNQNGK